MTLAIGPDSAVTMHFAIRLDSGAVVDSTFDKKPARFTMGDGNLLPGFEQVLIGLQVGDHRTFSMAPGQGFGQPNPNNIQVMARSQFKDMALSEGLMIMFNDAANAGLPGVVKSFDEQEVTIDFNHPLAGKTLAFEVEILAVEAA